MKCRSRGPGEGCLDRGSHGQVQSLITLVFALTQSSLVRGGGRSSLSRPARGAAVTVEPAAKAASTESVLVVRRAVDHDALWLLSPAGGTPTAAGDLPGFAGSVAVSPDGQNVAYLPENLAPRVWIGTGRSARRRSRSRARA